MQPINKAPVVSPTEWVQQFRQLTKAQQLEIVQSYSDVSDKWAALIGLQDVRKVLRKDNPPSYALATETYGEIVVTFDQLDSWAKFRRAMAAATGDGIILDIKHPKWAEEAVALRAMAVETVEVEAAAETEANDNFLGDCIEWANRASYWETRTLQAMNGELDTVIQAKLHPADEWASVLHRLRTAEIHAAWAENYGLVFKLSELTKYLRTVYPDITDQKSAAVRLHRCGLESLRTSTVRLWCVPWALVPGDIDPRRAL